MEGKQQSLLLIKSATALNSLLIFSIVCVVFYHHQRVAKLELNVLVYHDMERFPKDSRQFSSLLAQQENQKVRSAVPLNVRRNQPQHVQGRARETLKDRSSNVWNAASVNGGRSERKQSSRKRRSPRVNTTHTSRCSHCSHCLNECFQLGSPKVKHQNISGPIHAANGKCIIVQGVPGQPGMPGMPGKWGRRGRRGSRGKTGKPGPVGPAGSPGKQGPKGSTGPPGKRAGLGLTGLPGPAGEKGQKGDTTVVGVKGDKGDRGDDGAQGPRGVEGVKGETGSKGVKGEAGGQKGDRGLAGQQGPKGEIGPRGCSGTVIKQPSLSIGQKQMTVNESETANLICNASANPVSRITWIKNNATIKGNRFVMDQKILNKQGSAKDLTCPSDIPHPITVGKLAIKQLEASDSGIYTCRATNMMGVTEYKIQVTVQLRVRLSVSPSDTTVVQGENVALSCQATGAPQPLITWQKKDGGQLPGKRSLVSGVLRMYGVRKKDEGVYVCTASNVLGFEQAEALLTVNGEYLFNEDAV